MIWNIMKYISNSIKHTQINLKQLSYKLKPKILRHILSTKGFEKYYTIQNCLIFYRKEFPRYRKIKKGRNGKFEESL